MDKIRSRLKTWFPMSFRGWAVLLAALLVAALLCLVLRGVAAPDVPAPLIFVLFVLVVSLTTDGYFYGLLASVISVFAVNWAFTYPYLKMDFSIYGYPLTFVTMLAVGFAVSTLTGRVREQERIRRESEREKMRANLLRAVSHDLRTPLTAISGSLSVLLEDGCTLTEEECRELLIDARNDADWLTRIMENLLSITRISGDGVAGIKKDPQIMEEIISEAVINFRKRNPGITVSVKVPDELLFVPMDAMLIEQVLINLMDNSVAHGRTTTKIFVNVNSDDKYARVRVSDNGKGIDMRLLDHLFDGSLPLSGGKAPDESRYMGIGLSVCKTIVEAHGGTIFAQNRPGSGAEFIFTLELGGTDDDYQG